MGQIGAKDIGADLAFGADLALSILQSSFVFLGELFEAVPRLNRSIMFAARLLFNVVWIAAIS